MTETALGSPVSTPLAVLHAWIDTSVPQGRSRPALAARPSSTVMDLFGLALIAAAYRRVARG
jgi:hypothetical protein